MENGNDERKKEEEAAEPDRELGQDRRGLGTEKVVGEAAAKGGPKPLAFWTLHEDREDQQEADDHEKGDENRHEEPHRPLLQREDFSV